MGTRISNASVVVMRLTPLPNPIVLAMTSKLMIGGAISRIFFLSASVIYF
jgi:hypothetical protein